MTKNVILATAMALAMTTASYAGGYTAPTVTVTPIIEAPVDMGWTGGYAGVAAGTEKVTVGPLEADETAYGVFAGYRQDLGNTVVGGELSHTKVEGVDLSGTVAEVQVGADAGRLLPYASVGYGKFEAGDADAEGIVYGVGADYRVNDKVLVGVKYNRADLKDEGVDVENLTARLGFRF